MSKTEEGKNKTNDKMIQIVVFRLGDEDYALQIDQIKEVVRTPSVTPMPQSPKYIRGVANIRGNIIAIVDLEERFGLATRSLVDGDSRGHYTLVVESEDFKMGILVRDVPNTLAIGESSIDTTMMSSDDQGYIRGIVKVEKRLIILIDIFRIIEHKETAGVSKQSVIVA